METWRSTLAKTVWRLLNTRLHSGRGCHAAVAYWNLFCMGQDDSALGQARPGVVGLRSALQASPAFTTPAESCILRCVW